METLSNEELQTAINELHELCKSTNFNYKWEGPLEDLIKEQVRRATERPINA